MQLSYQGNNPTNALPSLVSNSSAMFTELNLKNWDKAAEAKHEHPECHPETAASTARTRKSSARSIFHRVIMCLSTAHLYVIVLLRNQQACRNDASFQMAEVIFSHLCTFPCKFQDNFFSNTIKLPPPWFFSLFAKILPIFQQISTT